MRKLLILVVLLLIVGVAWFIAGRGAGPAITIDWPTKAIGQTGELSIAINSPGAKLTRLDVTLQQGEKRFPVFTLPEGGSANVVAEAPDRVRFKYLIGKKHTPELEAGKAQIVVTAGRPTFFGLQEKRSSILREIDVRLIPPQVAILSTHHYVNLGGSEMVVYRVTPGDVPSGVRVGDREYQGFPASAAGMTTADSSTRVAFFALLWDQDPSTPMTVFARDDAGNEGIAQIEHRVFPKVFRRSVITVDDGFLSRVVPAILQNTPEFKVDNPGDLIGSYIKINRDLRKENDAKIAALAQQTAPRVLWEGAFKQLGNTAVEAGFADRRTYTYKGDSVDHQTHLGFDLASTAAAPVLAANHGKVLHAGWLGIYGNCVILDHGMGLQSLYAHLSVVKAQVGDSVRMNDEVGRSGTTGLAGGDHLHFTMLLGGRAITPVDWWSTQWVEDRIMRKLRGQ